MTLHCTLVRGPASGRPGEPLELAVEVAHGCPGRELQEAMAGKYGTGELTVGGQPVSALSVGSPPLVNGAVLVDGFREAAVDAAADPGSDAPLFLAVHGGPGAGMLVPLRRGKYVIGRSHADVVIPDADLSRQHARLEVSDTAVRIVDLGSSNGTTVDGHRLGEAPVSTESVIRCGSSTLSIVHGSTLGPGDADVADAGRSVEEPLRISRRADHHNRTSLVLTAALPLVVGVGLALATGMWMFLAFTAVSAVSVLVPVVSGRRQRREFKTAQAAAVEKDQQRRRRSAPSAATLALAVSRPELRCAPEEDCPKGVWLRLGLADQPANIRVDPQDPDYRPPLLAHVPFTLDPSVPVALVRGPEAAVGGLLRSIIMQLAVYPLAARTRVVVHGPVDLLSLPARYLPHTAVSVHSAATAALLEAEPCPEGGRRVLIIIDDPRTGSDSALTAAARELGWQVIHWTSAAEGGETEIILGPSTATLVSGGLSVDFIADLVPPPVFDRFCRRFAATPPPEEKRQQSIPEKCSLGGLIPADPAALSRRWTEGRTSPGLPVPIGRGVDGPRILDLQGDGPHLLVAGTTGSGKSELLRGLTAALALTYPPDRINFLFIDFKGGSGLAPLVRLPHCVGMLTDLARGELDRSLASLRAEVRRREELLAAAQAPDLASYRQMDACSGDPLPHLVIIIDEFRMLVEDTPDALGELMKIATIGRSLGLHLVMATQRPQGALNADIRANVTTSIALRVQSPMESADIVNSPLAADIPVRLRGRAYLCRGTEEPEPFQAASLAGDHGDALLPAVLVRTAAESLLLPPLPAAPDDPPAPAVTPAQAAAPIIEATLDVWNRMEAAPPRRPVAPPLPPVLRLPDGHGTAEDGPHVELGLMDLPREQRVARLAWGLLHDGHLGLVGGPASGAAEVTHLAVQQLLAQPAESHLYILDADGSHRGRVQSARVGAVAGLHELRRAVRILQRFAEEMSLRLSRPAGTEPVPLVLLISGWGSWVSAFRAGPYMWAEDLVQDIVRDGAKARIIVLLAGERELVTSRFFSALPSRAYFPSGSNEEGRIAWPKLPPVAPVPGRAVVSGVLSGGPSAVSQFYTGSASGSADRKTPAEGSRPFRVEPLPLHATAADILQRFPAGLSRQRPGRDSRRQRRLCVGIGGDELEPLSVALPQGGVLAVLGGSGSGKSSLLRALPALNPSLPWIGPEPGPAGDDYWADLRRQAAAGQVRQDAILLADDADLLSGAANQQLLDLNGMGWSIVFTAGFGSGLMQRVPLALAARGHGDGILIAPRSLMDGDFFGLRFEVEAHPPPGRGVVLSGGGAIPVQLAAAERAMV